MAILDALTVSDTGIKDGKSLTDIAKSIADFGSNVWKDMTLLEKTALTTSMIPVVGDIAGLAADAEMYATKPEERNLLNYAMSMAGVLPGVPAVSYAKKASERVMPSSKVKDSDIAAEDLMLAKRLMDLGYLKPESAGNKTQINSAVKKYNAAMQNPAFAEREALAASNDYVTIFREAELPAEVKFNPETLLGRALIPINTDRSDIGMLDMVGGIPAGTAVQGGDKFSRQNQGTDTSWMSMFDTAKRVQTKVGKVEEKMDGDAPIGVNVLMGLQSSNFSTAIAEPALKQIQAANLPKEVRETIDKKIRAAWPKGTSKKPNKPWVGIDSPEAMDQIMGRGDFPNVGKNKTVFVEALGGLQGTVSNALRDQGAPNIQELYYATARPGLVNQDMRTAGSNFMQMRSGDARYNPGRHGSYDGEILGDYLGGGLNIPFDVLFEDQMAKQSGRILDTVRGPRPITPMEARNAIADSSDGFEVIDSRRMDSIMDYLDRTGQL